MSENGREVIRVNGHKLPVVFDLDDLIEPGYEWKYLGVVYHYVRWSSMGLIARRRIDNLTNRLVELEKIEAPTEAHEVEYDRVVYDLLAAVTTDLPQDVSDAMEPELRAQVGQYFLERRRQRISALNAMKAASLLSLLSDTTSEKPSPDSTATGRKKTRKRG